MQPKVTANYGLQTGSVLVTTIIDRTPWEPPIVGPLCGSWVIVACGELIDRVSVFVEDFSYPWPILANEHLSNGDLCPSRTRIQLPCKLSSATKQRTASGEYQPTSIASSL